MNGRRRISNNKLFKIGNLWIAIILLFFIKPQIIDDLGLLDIVFSIGRVLFSMIYMFLLFAKSKKINKIWLYFIVIFLVNLIVTIINQGMISKSVAKYFPAVGIVAYIIYNRNKIINIFHVLIRLELVLLSINLFTFFIFPNGIVYREEDSVAVWLLGQKQDLAGFIFPMLFIIVFMNLKKKCGKGVLIYAYIISLVTVWVEKSITALICMIILGILFIWDEFFANKIKKTWLIAICVLMFCAIQYIGYNFEHMQLIQKLLLGLSTGGPITKVRTLGVRFLMWKFAWNLFFKSPIVGMGELSENLWMKGVGFYHSVLDNMYMDIIMGSGIIGIVLFLLILKKAFNVINCFKQEKFARFLNYILFVMCIYTVFGSPFFAMVFLIFLSGAWLPYIEDRV